MPVSRRVAYRWVCSGCGNPQEIPVWRILDSRERNPAGEPVVGLAYAVCPECRGFSEIDAPLLLIRPGNVLPWLLGLPLHELEDPMPRIRELASEAHNALGTDAAGITEPMVPMPRLLLSIVLARDLTVDLADPDRATQEVIGQGAAEFAGLYRRFLEIVIATEPDRRLVSTLQKLWSVWPAELAGFLRDHPELASSEAAAMVREESAQVPPGESDEPVRARLALVEGLASGREANEVAREYLAALDQFGAGLHQVFDQLLADLNVDPMNAPQARVRQARQMAIDMGRTDEEAGLNAHLAALLLAQPFTSGDGIDEIIALLQRSLSLLPEDNPLWLDVAVNLASAYHRRPFGDAIGNWEAERQLLERALEVCDRAADTPRWAIIQTNYGLLLAERPGGGREDLTRGIEHIEAGLQERSPERNVVDWAYSLLNLGLLLSRRNEAADHVRARACYQQALTHLSPGDDLVLWATLQNNLADLLLSTDSPDLDAAEAAARSAVTVIDAAADPLTAGRLTWMLARVKDQRTGPLSADALRLRREAFQMLNPQIAPSLHLAIGGELFEAYARLDDWTTLADIAVSQLTAFGNLYNAQTTAEDQRRVLADDPRLARWAAYALARAGRAREAIEAIEHGRARQLTVAVSRDTADLARLTAIDEHLASAYRAALAAYRAALNGGGAAASPADSRQQITAAEKGIQRVLSEIRDIPGLERFLQPATVADINDAAGGHPVIYLVSAPWGSYVLIVRPHQDGEPEICAIHIPEVTSTIVVQLITVSPDGAPGFFLAQAADNPRLLRHALRRLPEISPLIGPVAEVLAADPDNVAIVIPTGLLALLPLAAVPVPGRPGQVLDDMGEVHLAPSAEVYGACQRRASQCAPLRLVGVANPAGTPPLPAAAAELAAIRDLFPASTQTACAFEADATRSWLLAQLPGASHVHLACHGFSEFTSQIGGSLLLAGNRQLTIRDLIDGRLTGCRLATASACQSGHYSIEDAPEEFTGLPAGFLQAGAACAVVSLWQVDDEATALLMTRFYELLDLHRNNITELPVRALREARTWLRHLTAQQARQYIQDHTHLSGSVACHASPTSDPTPSYAAAQYWAAFSAWGY